MVHKEDLRLAGESEPGEQATTGRGYYVVTREFKVYASSAAEAKLELEHQLEELAQSAIAIKQIAAAMQRLALEDAADRQGARLDALPPVKDDGKKDYGPN